MAPKEELSIEVGQVDGVHVDDVEVGEAGEGQVLEQLAAQAPRAHDQHSHRPQRLQVLTTRRERVHRGQRARSAKYREAQKYGGHPELHSWSRSDGGGCREFQQKPETDFGAGKRKEFEAEESATTEVDVSVTGLWEREDVPI